MDYQFDTLDPTDDSETGRARRRAWFQAVAHGFHQGGIEEDYEKIWLEHLAADDVVCRGAWLPEGTFGADVGPVATTSWFDKTLNLGRELLPLRMVTDVTTSPAHRRRGLVRRLMEDCLADAAAQRVPVSALTASEATIYGRWGYGLAAFGQEMELDTGPRFRLRQFTDPGRVELLEAGAAWPMVHDQLERFHRRSRGSVGIPQFYENYFTGRWNFQESGPDKKLRAAVHLDADEQADGVVLWRTEGQGDKRTLKVVLHLAEHPDARLALWQFIGGLDLVTRVSYGDLPPEDPLLWALHDLNTLTLGARYEFLWVRVLDVARCCAARPWEADGDVVVEVTDAQGYAAGRHRVVTRDGVAEVSASDRAGEVHLDAETLGSLSLGGVRVGTLAGAGRIRGEAAALERFAAMADLPDQPYNILGF